MRRNTSPQNLENGQDSFLDVVSNIVGILIILVVIVGAQVKNGLTTHRIVEFEKNRNLQRKQTEEITRQTDSPSPEEQFVDTELDSELNALLAEGRKDQNDEYEKKKRSELIEKIKVSSQKMNETTALERKLAEEAVQLEIQQKRMEAEQLVFAQECVQMETRLRLIQKEIESSTEKKDQERNAALQLTQTSIEMDRKIEELKNRIKTLANQQAANGGPKKIEHKMTPIIHSVDSKEFHFILDRGRILYVPLDELLKEYERRIPGMMTSLMQSGVRTEILGPYDGFKMHTETRLQGGRVGVYWKLIPPPMEEAAETIDTALETNSKFRHYLEKLDPAKDTLTFWIYPEGFTSFARVKDDAYRLGFSIASRPLPEGMPIAGSPDGQKSVAQ
ncbi:MAG: hypothetical protein IJF17_07195 [Thermoguttaceae bacterium]|nr:hypothetical protein [Thermoguttaceae bacterium]